MCEIPDGVHAASLTPLRADLSIDEDRFAAHVRWLLNHGCDGVALMGTTGEATSFSVAERQHTLEKLLEAGLPPERMMVGTGCAAIPDTVALTRHALQCGITSVLMLPPFYYKRPGDEGLYAAYDQVIQSVADARLRIYLYHFPQMSAVPLSHALVACLKSTYPKAIAGLKDSSGNLNHMLDVMDRLPELRFFAGTETLLPPVLRAGGAGCISATVNVTCILVQALYREAHERRAAELLRRITRIRAAVEAQSVIPMLKAIMAYRTRDPEWRHVRPPLAALQEVLSTSLDSIVTQCFRPWNDED